MIKFSESFPDDPFEAVAVMGLAEFSGDCKAQFWAIGSSLPNVHGDLLSKKAAGVSVQVFIVGASEKARRLGVFTRRATFPSLHQI